MSCWPPSRSPSASTGSPWCWGPIDVGVEHGAADRGAGRTHSRRWYLRLVRPLDAGPVRVGRPGGLALAAAMAAVPLAVAFRAPLLPFLSAGLASQPAGGVVLLSLGAAVLAGALVFGATSMARRARHGRRSSR